MKYLFGPVPSRRLGISLGVDIVPYKTCSFNCVYCECGRTFSTTFIRQPYIKAKDIIAELDDFLSLSGSPQIDYVTFSGGGEPTLNSEIREIINFIKKEFPQYPLALLTNSSLLGDSAVREDIKKCDVIIPSLDGVSDDVFKLINRPCEGVIISDIIDGLKNLKTSSHAKIWVEVFIVPGVNDTDKELNLLKEALLNINPDKVQINTIDRPAAESWVKAASGAELIKVKNFFNPLNVEIITNPACCPADFISSDIEESILSTLKRRPCTLDDIRNIFLLEADILNEYLQKLEKSGKIKKQEKKRGVFYEFKKIKSKRS